MGTMHNGTMTSQRNQRLLRFLSERGERGATTAEIHDACDVQNPATAVMVAPPDGPHHGITRQLAGCQIVAAASIAVTSPAAPSAPSVRRLMAAAV